MLDGFSRAYPPAPAPDGEAHWFVFVGRELLVVDRGFGVALPDAALAPTEADLFLGSLDGVPCRAATVEFRPLPERHSTLGLRQAYLTLDPRLAALAGYASQMLHWHRVSKHCGACGALTVPLPEEWGRECRACLETRYPPVHPCVIVLVHDRGRALLIHQPGWGPMHALVAGFVEPGESLEDCVRRELREEVGIEVEDLDYFDSQPWPFPHQLMIGFFARYKSGELVPQASELDFAGWFSRDDLPALPPRMSIARRLIDEWLVGG